MTNNFEKGITNEDIEDLDTVIDSSDIAEPESDDIVEDSGIVDIGDVDFEDIGEYKPSLESANKTNINKIITENLSYIASRDDSVFAKKQKALIEEIEAYKKNLIINKGFTDEEASAAAEKRAEKRSIEETNEYKTANPEVAIIKVDKKDSGKLEIAPEDQPKVHKATSIRLVEVEDVDLAHIKIKKNPTKMPINIAKMNTCTLTRYTIPCINTIDMCTFAGTSTYNLVSLYFSENDSYKSRLTKQMDLAYEKFVSSATKEKYTATGALAMTKEDFLNWFAFEDLTAAIFAIYVASSTEMITTKFECRNETCVDINEGKEEPHKFDYSYNCKDILSFANVPENFKAIYEGILEHKNDFEAMTKLKDENDKGHRYKSSITNNIYDVETPSCARALAFVDYLNNDDDSNMSAVYFAIAIHIAKMYLYCGEEDGEAAYMEVSDPETIYNIVADAIEPEFELYRKKLIADKSYNYDTSITYTCDKCGNTVTNPVDVASLVFLKAQRMGSEIE